MVECVYKLCKSLNQKHTASLQHLKLYRTRMNASGPCESKEEEKSDKEDTATPLFSGEVQDGPQGTDIILQVHY